MAAMAKKDPVRCYATIEGPKVHASGVIAWRKYCKRMTTHESGRCWQHRPLERTA